MESRNRKQRKVLLSVDIGCCEKCAWILEKKLGCLEGVESVVLYPEENLASVTGVMGTKTLLKDAASLMKKLGKDVEMLRKTKLTKKEHQQKHFAEEDSKDTETQSKCNSTGRNKEKKRGKSLKKEEPPHKCEAFKPKEIDPMICRDPYCKDHVPMRDISYRMPMEENNYNNSFAVPPLFPRSNPYGPSSYYSGMNDQVMPPGPFGKSSNYYGMDEQEMPPYGYYQRRPFSW